MDWHKDSNIYFSAFYNFNEMHKIKLQLNSNSKYNEIQVWCLILEKKGSVIV